MTTKKKKCILVLAANPQSTALAELEREAKIVATQLADCEYGEDYEIRIEQGMRIEDLRRYLLEYQPTIVHVVGQGSATGEIVLADDSDRVAPVTPAEIAHLFATTEQQIECVVLNSCFSLEMADALLEFIPCTIGIDEDNDDPDAETFLSEFYQGIFSGEGYYRAYEWGRDLIPVTKRENDGLPCLMTIDRTLLGVPPEYAQQNVSSTRGMTRFSTGEATPTGEMEKSQSEMEKPQVYPLWYGTNRKPKDSEDLSKGFSGQGDDRVHYGTCEVVVRKTHKSRLSKWISRLFTEIDNQLKFDRASLKPILEPKDFWANIKSTLAKIDPDERNALVFIHGYNVSFEGAAKTAAQLGCELEIPMTAFYSWPSKGKLLGYIADEDSIQASEKHIADFLTEFVKVAQADRVHVIAHSMGNRGLLRSIEKIAAKFQGQAKPFNQIILAAPDVEPTLFKNEATTYQSIAERTTLYVSRKDKALSLSSWLHKNSRTGFSPEVTIVPPIETIDVSNTDLTLLGHGYCMEDRQVLDDMYYLLTNNKPPLKPRKLVAAEYKTQKYWIIE
jgi:esterase/lipase superfamily enzyme